MPGLTGLYRALYTLVTTLLYAYKYDLVLVFIRILELNKLLNN